MCTCRVFQLFENVNQFSKVINKVIREYKLVVYGGYGIGKTALVNNLVFHKFDARLNSTIGASFVVWNPDASTTTSVGIWDTAGQERFSCLLPMYFRGADAVVYCWDSLVPLNTTMLTDAYHLARTHSPECLFYVAVTKMDRRPTANAVALATFTRPYENWMIEHQLPTTQLFFTSAVTGQNVANLFYDILTSIRKRGPAPSSRAPGTTTAPSGTISGCPASGRMIAPRVRS